MLIYSFVIVIKISREFYTIAAVRDPFVSLKIKEYVIRVNRQVLHYGSSCLPYASHLCDIVRSLTVMLFLHFINVKCYKTERKMCVVKLSLCNAQSLCVLQHHFL